MKGPYKLGTLHSPLPPATTSWEHTRLSRGSRYRVAGSFVDADGDEHPSGEEWIFLNTTFSKFDNELTIQVRKDNGEEWKIPLVWERGRQWDVLENWSQYFRLC